MVTTAALRVADKAHVWHPFTQMQDWCADDPIIITEGRGVWLYDSDGNRYLDGVASMWTNVHGHCHPELNKALANQAARLEHSTLLGLASEQSILLAEELVKRTPTALNKVFYSDNGSTAMEVALKMAYQYHCHHGEAQRTMFVRLEHAYHGDTIGAMSIGGIGIYHDTFHPLLFETVAAPAPYCYRCSLGCTPDSCQLACLAALERLVIDHGKTVAGVVLEPCLQGAGGMLVHPKGFLAGVRALCDRHGVLLILDEVATGFGRTGRMFACQHEEVCPDILALSKGLCAGYLPLAATMATDTIYQAFLGNYHELKTFFHGHTFTGNPLACAVALASLALFDQQDLLAAVHERSVQLASLLKRFVDHPHVGDIRQIGLAAGIELVMNRTERTPFAWEEKIGVRISQAARRHGVFTRPLGNTLVLFPPLCISEQELDYLVDGVYQALVDVLGDGRGISTLKKA